MLPRYLEKPINWTKPEKKLVKLSELKARANDIRAIFFSSTASFLDHIKLQQDADSYAIYMSVLLVLLRQNCELQFQIKWKVLSSSFACKHYDLADYLLYHTDQFNLPEVLKSVRVLDMQRNIRQLKKRVTKLERCGAKRQTVNAVKQQISELEKEVIPEDVYKTSVTGSLAKRIRKWVGKFSEAELAFFSVQMPKKPWKELADIVHFSPKDFKLPYFLPCAFGSEAPEDSLVARCKNLTVQNVEEVVTFHKVPYSYLRKNCPMMSVKVKEIVAKYEKIDTLIWYYEEFTSNGAKKVIDQVLEERLKRGEIPSLNYGKLLERILYFKMSDSDYKDPTASNPLLETPQISGSGNEVARAEGKGWLKELRFSNYDENKEVVSVIVTTCESSSYDNLFNQVPQRVPNGRVALYALETRGTEEILRIMRGDDNAKTEDEVVKRFISEVESLDPDCVLFNWECCQGCSDRGFKSPKVIELVECLLNKGHVVMFSDFAVKALIGQWDERRLGPKCFTKIGECSSSIELHFSNAVLDECGIPQLEAVGKLCEKGQASLHCLGGTVVVGVDMERAGKSDKYMLEVLTVAAKVDGKDPRKHPNLVDMDDFKGTVGHAVLRYATGGEMIVSAGHWIELSKLDTSVERIEKWASQYGNKYDKEIEFLKNPSVSQQEKKRKIQEMSKIFVQQMPSVKQKKKSGKKFYEYLIPIAEEKLKMIDLKLEKPFYIFGDASASMMVCVRTSAIIASFITCITDAKLMFFNTQLVEPKIQPKTIDEVIDVALTTQAKGRTGPARIVSEFYKKKKKVKVFLIVTDEVENVMVDGTYFAQHFYKYYNEIYPAKLVMVSFLKNPSQFESGQMFQALKNLGIDPVVFSMHLQRPDLQKLDKLVGLLSLETSSFYNIFERVYSQGKEGGLGTALTELRRPMREAIPEVEEEEENEGEAEEAKKDVVEVVVASSSSSVDDEHLEAPKDFLCPITREVMSDPVVCSDGYTYERTAIVKWINTKASSPMTGAKLTETVVFPNHGLKSRIVEYLEEKKKKEEIEKAK